MASDTQELFLFILKYLFTLYIIILIPTYWKNYGVQNFFWISDFGVFLTLFALWFHSSLIISIVIISVLPLEIAWCVDFAFRLITGRNPLGVVDYMFQSKYSLLSRGLSLFHIILPILWFWCLSLWGYDVRALGYAIILVWVVGLATYLWTDPKNNVNLIFLSKVKNWNWMPPPIWLIILLIAYPLFVLWPLHEIFKRLFFI